MSVRGSEQNSSSVKIRQFLGQDFRVSASAWVVCWCPTSACLSDPALSPTVAIGTLTFAGAALTGCAAGDLEASYVTGCRFLS